MDFAKNVILQLLKESIEQPKVEDAIRKHYEVEITYLPKRKRNGFSNGEGRRIIQPTTLGISKSGNMVVRAFQPYGDTQTRVPHWKMFVLDNIQQWKPTNKVFSEPPGLNKELGRYNPNGDESMSTVLLNATFGGDEENNVPVQKSRLKRDKISYNPNKGNRQSISDMSKNKDFGDENFSQTIGPVLKNDTSNKMSDKENRRTVSYSNARQNGPVYKGEEDNNLEPNIYNDERD